MSGRFVVVSNYDASMLFYLLAKEFGWTEQDISNAHVPFVMKLLENAKIHHEQIDREMKRRG